MSADRVRWTISVVSHGHGAGVARVIGDLHARLGDTPHRFVLTLNAGEDPAFIEQLPQSMRSRLRVIANARPRGFGANHNAALRDAESDFVLVADPDLTVEQPVFAILEAALSEPRCGIVAPLAQTPDGAAEDNGRALVTPVRLLRRRLLGRSRDVPRQREGRNDVDWLAGLFMAMRSETFRRLGGFDERYHLYCEDVDICLRARQLDLSVELLCGLRVTHQANRDSLRKPRHFLWHVQSLLRLWRSPVYREAQSPGTEPLDLDGGPPTAIPASRDTR
jgi:N-acetylglucosaminyl-diphospho-decaprenol L-rhamnosyltransferase